MLKIVMLIIKILLLPVSFLYGVVVEIRNIFYDYGFFKSYKFDVPVISVGNITAGGTGKTPFVIWLAKRLSQKYKKIAIISRGYGRASKGLLVVTDYKNPRKFGDEPCLIAAGVPQAELIVSERRKAGIEYALREKKSDLIILDDAFQHRSVRRDINIVLINAIEKFKYNFPIPSGTLREFKHNLKRSDLLILTNSDNKLSDDFSLPAKPLFTSRSRLDSVVNFKFEVVGRINDFAGESVTAFSGIAHPEIFKRGLQKNRIKIENHFTFSDHYAYREEDIIRIIKDADERNCKVILCTEKDLVKIAPLQNRKDLPIRRIYAVRLETEIAEEKKLLKKITDHIDKYMK